MSVIRAAASIGRLHLHRWTHSHVVQSAKVSSYTPVLTSNGQIKRWYATEGNQPDIKAVIFDMGGVLISQPAPIFAGLLHRIRFCLVWMWMWIQPNLYISNEIM